MFPHTTKMSDDERIVLNVDTASAVINSGKSKSPRDRSPNIQCINENLFRELVKKRGILKGRLTKFANYLKYLQNNENAISSSRDRIDLKLRIKGASNLFTEFNDIQNQIEEMVYDSEVPDQLSNRESFENSYYSTIALGEYMLSSDETTDGSRSSYSDNSKSVKLPTISMPTFDGSYEHWLEFRDTFVSLVHNSKQISSIQKFHYLKSSLKGSAMLVLESLEFSSDNYSVAWELLLNRYNNSRLLVHNHVKALFTINALPKESPACIRKLIDTILKNLRALKILGEPTDNWDTLINYIIVSKLDKTTEREWETYKSTLLVNNSNSKRMIKTTDLIGFLKERADMLETLQLSHNKGHQSQHENKKQTTHNTSHCNVSTNKPQDRQHRFKPCLKCNAMHPLYSCQKFLDCDLESKLKLVRDHKLCENCLRSGHAPDTCKFGPCRKCNQKHNSLIHNDSTSSVAFNSIVTAEKPSDPLPIHVNKAHMQTRTTSIDTHTVLLSTAVVEVADSHGAYRRARALLDSGSQRCFISKSFCKLINAPLLQSTHEVRGVGDSVIQCSETCSIEIKSHIDNTFTTRLDCFVLAQITSTIPALCQLSAQFCIPDNIRLADPQFLDSKDVDILIGADRFWDLLGEGKFRLPNGPFLQNTKLGWIISGPISNQTQNITRINCNFSSSIDTQLRSFWEIEELETAKNTQTEEERACEEHFLRTTTRDSEGRFSVCIPFKESPSQLGDSYDQAERRFIAIEKRLQRSPEYKILYANFMMEYESLGHMSPVTSYESPCYFLPHHGVYREHSTTTKLRVVFDASAPTTSGKSLNDLQLIGPAIQGDLISILLRFRQHKYVVCADVTKMFRNCLVERSQRNLQMILWRDDPSKQLGIYQLNTVTYGTASAPFLSVRCLKQLGMESSNPDVQRVVRDDFYVDDLLTGNNNKASLLKLCDDIRDALQSGCFPLQKWMFNFRRENDGGDDDYSNQSKEIKYNESVNSKTLGLGWNNISDEFYFNTQFQNDDKPVTKRSILSNVSQIFDPLGLLSPTIIVAKVLLQQLWLLKIGWDDAVPCSVARTWNRFVISLQYLNNVRIPRHAIGNQPSYVELHVFSDASQTAYGACVYVRTVNEDKTLSVRLLTSKAKVAPLKPMSIPRLELCGALLGAKLLDRVRSSLTCKFDNVVCWTDSTIVLGWLHMAPNKLKTFVQNRTSEINDITKDVYWRHVRTKENPADLASRGLTLEELSSSILWWEGPIFLRNPSYTIHDYEVIGTCEDLPDLRPVVSSFVVHESSCLTPFAFDRFSQYNRMKRAVAFLLRFIHNIRNKIDRHTGILTVDELNEAEVTLIRWSQMESYPSEYKLLSSGESIKGKGNLTRLDLFLDKNKIMRVGGRLGNSEEFSYNKMYPILLSSKHYFTMLLFRFEHLQHLHAGAQALLCHLREKWWPLGGRNLARHVVSACVTCTRMKGKILTPHMGNLPKERITSSFPFNRCGVDYCGPVLILNRKGRGAKTLKAYICLFVCFVTRAIHLELVSDLTTEAYLLALNRFISRRGKPIEIFSDNGRNFVGLMNDFSDFLQRCSTSIIEYATSQTIKFKFIPPYSPHFGGLWEAGVKSCKHHLRRVVGNVRLTFEEFYTVLSQIEAVLNSRPLSPLSPDPKDFTPLTPGHFLVGRPLTAPVSDDLSDTPALRLNRYQRVEQIRQHFWTRWSKEFISELQIRNKWTERTTELKTNSLVLIKDNNLPPLKWHMGRVLATIPGKDGISRVADIQTSSGVVRRSYAKICPLLQDAPEKSTGPEEG